MSKIISLTSPLPTYSNVGISRIQRSSKTNLEWFREKSCESMQMDLVYAACSEAISLGRYHSAVEIMLNEIYNHCRILAKIFGKDFKGKAYVSDLIEQLRKDDLINEEDSNRLSVIVMAMDGLEIEVREYGGTINKEDLEYMMEFIEITRNIMLANNMYTGIAFPSFTPVDYKIMSTAMNGIAEIYTANTLFSI